MRLKDHVIICTAGHIDHGKTALVKALTGVDADTLPEEKRRGMTIELGFVFMEDPEAVKQIVFIDVPGHEKFIRTMAAGSAHVDAALLVIAADEGISVQTREHFDILRLLRVPVGLVALSKCDLVSEETLDQRIQEIREFTKGSFLATAPVIPVSSLTGDGIDQLKSALRELTLKVNPRSDTGVFRLPIDRVFSLPGFGTIIAGTLLSGEVKVGDQIMVYPEGLETRVRNIHVHRTQQERAVIGLRTALNVPDLKKEVLRRGQVAAHPGTLRPSYCLDVSVELLPSASEIKNRDRIRMHLGTDEVCGRVSLLDRGVLRPGEEAPAQVFLEEPAAPLPGDRFVIRTFSPCFTVGGGVVLDASPPKHKRFDPAVLAGFERLKEGVEGMVEEVIRRSGLKPLSAGTIGHIIGWKEEKVKELIPALIKKGLIVSFSGPKGEVYLHQEMKSRLEARLREVVAEFFSKHPHLSHMPVAELRARFLTVSTPEVFTCLLEKAAADKTLILDQSGVTLPGRTAQFTRRETEVINLIEEAYLQAGFTPPLEQEVSHRLKVEPPLFKKAIHALYQEKKLIRLNEKVTFHRSVWEKAEGFVLEYIRSKGKITIAELRDQLRISRKYACAILEYLDRRGTTRRQGDEHVLK